MKQLISTTPVLSPVNGKPVLLNFDGAEMSSDAGLTLLREVERRHDLAGLLAPCLTDLRDAGNPYNTKPPTTPDAKSGRRSAVRS